MKGRVGSKMGNEQTMKTRTKQNEDKQITSICSMWGVKKSKMTS